MTVAVRDGWLRIHARAHGRASLRPGGMKVPLVAKPLFLVPLFMSEPHIWAWGLAYGNRVEILVTADPRNRAAEGGAILEPAVEILDEYIEETVGRGEHAQVILPSPGFLPDLTRLMIRFRTHPEDKYRRLGCHLSFLIMASDEEGQVACPTATGLLASTWATGQDQHDDTHLGAALAWVNATGDGRQEALQAEKTAFGSRLDPEVEGQLATMLGKRAKRLKQLAATTEPARQATIAAEVAGLEQAVRQVVGDHVQCVLDATMEAVRIVKGAKLPSPAVLADQLAYWQGRWKGHYQRMFVRTPRAGAPLVSRTEPLDISAYHFIDREEALSLAHFAAAEADLVSAQLEKRLTPVEVIQFVPTTRKRQGIPGSPARIDVRTPAAGIRVRPNSQVVVHGTGGGVRLIVREPDPSWAASPTDAGFVRWSLEVDKGVRLLAGLKTGDSLPLIPAPFSGVGALRKQKLAASYQGRNAPWALDRSLPLPPAAPVPMGDPDAFLARYRCP